MLREKKGSWGRNGRILLIGLATGIAGGLVPLGYRYVLDQAELLRDRLIAGFGAQPLRLLLWLAILTVAALLIARLMRWEPLCGGSGIPQVEAEAQGYLSACWWRVLISKFVGGSLAMFGGLALGREGPSVQLGAMAGKGAGLLFRRRNKEFSVHDYLVCGAAAGLAAAFGAPLAGALFAEEEISRRRSPALWLMALIASVTGGLLAKTLRANPFALSFTAAADFPLRFYPLAALLGVGLGVLGLLFNLSLLLVKKASKKAPFRRPLPWLAIALAVAFVLAIYFPAILGSGQRMLTLLTGGGMALSLVALLLVTKYLFFLLSFASNAPGGILFPVLIFGAYLGAAGALLCGGWGLEAVWMNHLILLGMAGFFAAVVGTPATAILLVAEMSGAYGLLPALTVTSICAYAVPFLFHRSHIENKLLAVLVRDLRHKA